MRKEDSETNERKNEQTGTRKIEKGVPFLVRARVQAYPRLFPEEIKLDSERGLGNALALSLVFIVRGCFVTLHYVRSKSCRQILSRLKPQLQLFAANTSRHRHLSRGMVSN